MLVSIVFAVAGLALLLAGGELLVRGSVGLALRLGLAPLAIGLTVVAFATSSPELAVSVEATLAGEGGVGLGNVLGSNLCNIGLVLGTAALLRPLPLRRQTVRFDLPAMLAATLLFVLLLADEELSRLDGAVLLAGCAAYVAITLRAARQAVVGNGANPESPEPAEHPDSGTAADDPDPAEATGAPEPVAVALDAAATGRGLSVPRSVVLAAGGLAALVAGGALLVRGAVALATLAGVSPAVIGLSVVAVGTSLPELATSMIAARRDHGDLSVGNAVGSNLMNVLLVAGAAALASPLSFAGLEPADVWAVVAISVALWLVAATRGRLGRPAGAAFLAVYVLYVGWRLAGG